MTVMDQTKDTDTSSDIPDFIQERLSRIDMWVDLIKQETSFIIADWGRLSAPKISKKSKEVNPLSEEELNKIISNRLRGIKIT